MIHVCCTFCHGSVRREEAVHCAVCLALHHGDCRLEHGRCAAPGCGEERVLVPVAPEVRVAMPITLGKPCGEPTPPRRGRLAALAAALLALLSLAGLRFAGAESPVLAVPPVALPPVASPAPVATRVLFDSRQVSLHVRDFELPVVLELGERLVVTARETGYTHVVLERAGRPPEARLVAEPGDRIEVRAGSERALATLGESILLEPLEGGLVRVATRTLIPRK